MKGQMTIINLVAFFVVLIMFLAIRPVLETVADNTVAQLDEMDGINPYIDLEPGVMVPLRFALWLAIVLSMFGTPLPRSSGTWKRLLGC